MSKLNFRQIATLLGIPIGTVQWRYYKAIKALKISLGNLTASLLFAIAFILSNTRKKGNITQEGTHINEKNHEFANEEVNRENETKKEQVGQETLKNIVQDTAKNENVENIIQIPEQMPENVKIDNGYLLGISGLFFVTSIVFFIIFQKHQQKRKTKTSK